MYTYFFKKLNNVLIMFIEQSNETHAQSLFLWCKMLLPNSEKRIYNLQSKQLIKLFSNVNTIYNIFKKKLLTLKLKNNYVV